MPSTSAQTAAPEPEDSIPVVPAADPSRTLYVDTCGAIVRKRGGRIVVEKPDGEDREEVLSLPAVDIERVVLVGRANCTSAAQRFFLKRGIDTTFLSWNGRLQGHLRAGGSPRPALRRAQYRAAEDAEVQLRLARSFVRAKLTNQRTLLRRYARRRSAPTIGEGADDVDALLGRVSRCGDLQALRGVEGQATRRYYETWPALLQRGDPAFDFPKRTRRPPEDAVNALISFTGTLALSDVRAACVAAGLDPGLGFLHEPRRGCPGCALDLLEAFRPSVVHSVVLSMVNRGAIDASDVEARDGGVYLTEPGRKAVYDAYEDRRQTSVTPPGLGTDVAYHRAFEAQARLLARTLTSGADYVPFTIR